MKKLATIIATGGLVLGLAACGASPEDSAKQAVEDYVAAYQDKDYAKICDSIDPEFVKTIEAQGSSCADTLKKEGDAAPAEEELDGVEVLSATVSDDEKTATVKVKNSKGDENDVKLKKVDDAWKLSLGE